MPMGESSQLPYWLLFLLFVKGLLVFHKHAIIDSTAKA